MDLQNLKRWHWVIIGLLVGLGLSYMYAGWDSSATQGTIGVRTLQADLLRKETRAEGDPPIIRNLSLQPPRIVNGEPEWRVTFDYLDARRRGAYTRNERSMSEPFLVEVANNTGLETGEYVANIRIYLDAVAAANEGFDYQYMWWQEKMWVYILWTGGAVVLIGGVWPTFLNLLVGAGFGRPPREEKEDYDLSRFGKGKPEPAVAAAEPVIDSEELDAVTRAYEQRIGEGSVEDGFGEELPEPDAPAPIRQLKSGADAEEIPTARSQEEEEKEYGGEFYPVVKSVHKKKDE